MNKKLILLGGMPASGKTTLGKKISAAYKLPYLDKDTICDLYTNYVVAKQSHANDRSSNLYQKELRPLEYQILFKIGFEHASLGLSPILVAPFSSEFPKKEVLIDLEKKLKAIDPEYELITILLQASSSQVKENMSKRNRLEDQDKLNSWDSYIADKLANQSLSQKNVSVVFDSTDPDLWSKISLFFKDLK